ncbi:Hypothetical protein CINCED_3A010400 [Cinara cedri]|uniref:Uncharacterized protein n=1 Tax=Cinara cedri TaxID=506608 RepID=A0A5E4NGF7_9HEMI|nr:Hypothetical protein CINCED_3A010400 [Cinara cedri]
MSVNPSSASNTTYKQLLHKDDKKKITLPDVWCTLTSIQKCVSFHDCELKKIVDNIKSIESSLKFFLSVIDNIFTELNLIWEEKTALASEVKMLHERSVLLKNSPRDGALGKRVKLHKLNTDLKRLSDGGDHDWGIGYYNGPLNLCGKNLADQCRRSEKTKFRTR